MANHIKNIRGQFLAICVTAITIVAFSNCTKTADLSSPAMKKNNEMALMPGHSMLLNSPFSDLIAYKNSPHQLMMGYYRTWGDHVTDPANYQTRMTDLPDSMDIISVFPDYTPDTNPYWDTLKLVYIPYLHERGTKVIFTGGYFAGASSNPTGLANWVQGIMDKIDEYNYDGYDIDIESTASGAMLQDQIACFQALSQYLGPQSGTQKLLVYDTNQDGNALMSSIKNMVSYVFLQAYWRSAGSLTGTFNTYAPYISPSKFLVGVDYEDGTGYQSGQMPAYAAWQPTQGTKGGVFAYGIDMEGPNSGRHFVTTRAAIQSMNPANTSGTGVVFYKDAYYGGTATSPIPVGSYNLSQLQTYGFVNDWASSVTIPPGWTVTMYQDNNFSGTSWTLTASKNWFGALSPNANDLVSSVVIQ